MWQYTGANVDPDSNTMHDALNVDFVRYINVHTSQCDARF